MSTYEILDGVYKGPEVFEGDLDLNGTQIKDLGNLKTVKGYLDLEGTKVTSLGNLESVGESLDLEGTQVTSLGNLKSVGGGLYLEGTQVTSLGNLKSVGGGLYLKGAKIKDLGNLEYVGGDLSLPDNTTVNDFESYKKEAETFLKEIKPLDYTIHMNHENWIVRSEINNYLETGEV